MTNREITLQVENIDQAELIADVNDMKKGARSKVTTQNLIKSLNVTTSANKAEHEHGCSIFACKRRLEVFPRLPRGSREDVGKVPFLNVLLFSSLLVHSSRVQSHRR